MALQYVLPLGLVGAHSLFLYTNYNTMIAQPDPLAGCSAAYPLSLASAYVVCVILGMRFMKDRQPIELKAAMQVYNVYETLLSALMLYMFVTELIGKNVFTMRVDNSRSGARLAMAIWLSYQSKFIEYADTFFMVTRKKFDQVTFLHVLHHSEMAPLMLLWVHYAPGGTSAFGPMLNAGIHTLMYSYYFLTGLGFKPAWKVLMTGSQLVQFVVILFHAGFHIVNWNKYWVGWLAVTELLLMIQMLFLFGDFFVSSYGGGSKKKAPKKSA